MRFTPSRHRSERVDSSHAHRVSHAPWQITLDKLACENRGIAPSPPRSLARAVSRWSQELNVRRPWASPAGRQAVITRCTGTGSRRKGCGNMVRMEVADAAVNEIMATTFRVRVKRLILVKGTDYQDQLEEISYRIRALDSDVMSDEQFDEQVRRLRAERDRLKALPA